MATWINSGNAVLASDKAPGDIAAEITAIAKARFGFCKAVMLASRTEWNEMIERNPFPEAVAEPTTLHGFLLERQPDPGRVAALMARDPGRERIAVSGRSLYLHTPRQAHPSKLAPVIDRVLAIASTARNWNTVTKLKTLAERIEL